MKSLIKPIALDEKSYNVTILHKALAALELPVAKREVTQGNPYGGTGHGFRRMILNGLPIMVCFAQAFERLIGGSPFRASALRCETGVKCRIIDVT